MVKVTSAFFCWEVEKSRDDWSKEDDAAVLAAAE